MVHRISILLATLAALLALTAPAEAHRAAAHQATSSNWAGYAVSRPGVRFRRVAGTWVQPAARCDAGQRRYSAYWVGLGGFHSTATALEQIGTQVDCSSKGESFASAWYELVPAAPVHIRLPVRPGDRMSASVSVSRKTVRLYIANRTRGTVFSTKLHADHVDTTAAEWIVEAPSACDSGGCHALPLADFGNASFAGARATDVSGHAGPIADPAWSSTAMALAPDGVSGGDAIAFGSSSAGATPGALAASGDAFTVTYQATPAPAPEPTPTPAPAPAPLPAPLPSPTPVPVPPVPAPPQITPAGPSIG